MRDPITVTRREFLAGAGAVVTATAAGPVQAEWLPAGVDPAKLAEQGYERKFVTCFMCGAGCGLAALRKAGPDGQRVYLLPNATHPQRGYCGRGAAALSIWNHPLRIRTPLKRVGARGEGRFVPVSWDVALDEIAARLKANVAAKGERSVVFTSHDMTPLQQLAGWALGTPNIVNHSSNCLTPGAVARRMTFERPYDHHRRVDPDYENCSYLLLFGRTLQASMGAAARLAKARAGRGAKVVFIDPRQPDNALGGSEWVPIVPGTDTALVLALVREIIANGQADTKFLAAHTNAPLLIRADGAPLTEAELTGNKEARLYAVWNTASGTVAFQGVKRNAAGAATEFVQPVGLEPALDYAGDVRLASGETVPVKTAYRLLRERVEPYTPEHASGITGVRATTIRRIARDFVALGGVADDGWYLTRNANDTDAVRAVLILNALVGNIDRQGGLAFSRGAGLSFVSLSPAGDVSSPMGRFKLADTRRIDTIAYPESPGSFHAVIDAIETGKPYPVSTVICQATALVHREANVPRLLEALNKLDLFVVIDVLPQDVADHADYVLPSNFFLERDEVGDIKWTLHAAVNRSEAVLPAPAGVEGRDDLWILLELLRRAFPERALPIGYGAEQASAAGYAEYKAKFERNMLAAGLKRWAEGEPQVAGRVDRELRTQGYSVLGAKSFGDIPYKRPLDTLSGKIEVYGLRAATNAALRRAKVDPLPDYRPVTAYTLPTAPDEFYLVSGKSMVNGSGTAMYAPAGKALGDRTVWMNPADAQRLGIRDGSTIELSGLDTGQKGRATVQVTRRVRQGVLFTYAFGGGHRTTALARDERFAFMREGVNLNRLSPGRAEPVTGALANNLSVKVRTV